MIKHPFTIVPLMFSSALWAPAVLAGPDDAQVVLAQARAALGLDHRPAAGVRVVGTADFLGTNAPYTLIFGGHNFISTIDGPLSMTSAFDGQTAWERDWNKTQRILPLGDRDQALLSTWAVTGDWASADSPLQFTLAPEQAAADAVVLAFTWPGSPMTGTVEVGKGDHLPRRIAWTAGSEESAIAFGNFKPFEAAVLPTTINESGPSGQDVTVTLTGATAAPTFVRSPYQALPAANADTNFNNTLPADLEVKAAPTGHLLVHPLIGGKDLGWFIFDTGAGSTVLSTPVAKEAGFEGFGAVKAMGVGGATDANFYRVPDFTLGRVTIKEPIFVGIDLAFLDQYMGVRIGGIIGYDLLARCITEFDINGPRIALFDPASYKRDDAKWQELFLYERHPCVSARFEDHEAVFKLDTGAAQDTVTFHAPAVESLRLLEGRETKETQMGGVGGFVPGQTGKLAWFELGPERTEDLSVTFATQPIGAFADPYTAGNIGGQLMAPFTMVLDYPGRRIAFVPKP